MRPKTFGRLTGCACYLAGPMTACKDLGSSWRTELQDDLNALGIVVLDPCNKPIEIGKENQEAREALYDNHAKGDFEAVQRQMKVIRRVDLRCVDLASFIVCRLDGSHTTGTYEELAMATMEQKPILLWLDGDLTRANCNPWLYAQIDPEFVFESKQELLDYILTLHTSKEHPTHRKWMLFDFRSLYENALGINSANFLEWHTLGDPEPNEDCLVRTHDGIFSAWLSGGGAWTRHDAYDIDDDEIIAWAYYPVLPEG